MQSSSGSNLATPSAGVSHADSPSRNIINDNTRSHIDDDDSSIYSSNSRVERSMEGRIIDPNNKNQNQNRKGKAVRNIIENTGVRYSSNAKSRHSNQKNILPSRNVPKNVPIEEAENIPARLFFPNIETPTQRSSNSPKKEKEKTNRIAIENNVENKKGAIMISVFLTKTYFSIVLCCTID
jgi:hypothetical protein